MIRPPYTLFGAAQQYRRIGDDAQLVADTPAQLPCPGPDPCAYEPLPQGGDYITVYPPGYKAQSQVAATPTYTPTVAVATRSVRDVLLEALALGMMGGGAVAFGYGLAKPKAWITIAGALVVVAGAGLRLSVLVPWFGRAKDAFLAPGMSPAPATTPAAATP